MILHLPQNENGLPEKSRSISLGKAVALFLEEFQDAKQRPGVHVGDRAAFISCKGHRKSVFRPDPADTTGVAWLRLSNLGWKLFGDLGDRATALQNAISSVLGRTVADHHALPLDDVERSKQIFAAVGKEIDGEGRFEELLAAHS